MLELLVVLWLSVGLVLVGRFVEKRLATRDPVGEPPIDRGAHATAATEPVVPAVAIPVRGFVTIAQALNEERAIEAACGVVHQVAHPIVRAPAVEWWSHDRSRDAWTRTGDDGNRASTGREVEVQSALQRALRARATLVATTDEAARHALRAADAIAVIPVFDRALTVGALVVRGDARAAGSAVALEPTFDAIGAVLGVALANARLSRLQHDRQVKDPLTGLASVEGLVRSVARSLARGRVSVALMSMPQMRAINLRYGRQAGDRALAAVARLVALEAGEEAEVGRFGGATLLLVLPGVGAADAQRVVERIVARVGDTLRAGPQRSDEPLCLEAIVADGEGGDAESLLREAESRLTSRDGAVSPRNPES